MAAYLKAYKNFATQHDVDVEIDRLILWAVAAEARRDRVPFESAEYWRHHDLAVYYHERARQLMPHGS